MKYSLGTFKAVAVVVTVIAATFSTVSPCRANLIFDTAATQVQAGQDDVNPVNVTLPWSFTLYGTSENQIRLGSNGAFGITNGLNGTQYDSSQSPWNNTGAGKPIIAPLWDDLNTLPGNGIYGGTSTVASVAYANSYSFTVPSAYSYGGSGSATITFQVSLFNAATTVTVGSGDAFTFQAGDIAVSYASNNLTAFSGGSAAVGITDGNGKVTGMPGTTAGVLTTANRGLLPTNTESFLLFRWNGTDDYTASIEQFAVVPEPSTVLLVGIGLAGAALVTRRRRAVK